MQILKTFLLAAVLPVSLLPLRSEAQETAAQAKARAALEQKMEELNRQQAAPPAPAKSPAKPGAAPKEPVYAPYAPPTTPAAPPSRPATTPAPVTTAAPVQPAPAAVQAVPGQFIAEPLPSDPAAVEKARAAMEQKMAELEAQSKAQAEAQAKAQAPAKTAAAAAPAKTAATPPPKAAQAQTASAFADMPGPPSPLNASKEQRLQELSQRYRSDAITAEEYHAERARILAAP